MKLVWELMGRRVRHYILGCLGLYFSYQILAAELMDCVVWRVDMEGVCKIRRLFKYLLFQTQIDVGLGPG